MAHESTDPEDPAADPFETELVAYLDGELDPAAARKVEARLETDSVFRARAAELKKSFDLLDFLPRPEPSPTFTTRTMDQLPTVKPPARTAQPTAAARANPARSGPAPVSNVSTSMPVPLEPIDPPVRPARVRTLLWLAGACAVVAFAAFGYLATAAARPYLFPHEKEPEEVRIEVDDRVVEHLPLYAAVDDVAFAVELGKPDLFGDDPAVIYDPMLKIAPADLPERPTGKDFEALAKAFRALPAARQAEIVKLDRELHALEPKERDRLLRVLEAYAVWLERLPDPERRGVLIAATSKLRLGVIGAVRDRQWLDALPPPVRGNKDQIQQWREEEATRRDRLAFVRQHAEAFAANKSPWPFDTEAGRKEVQEFARNAFKPDDFARCRLSLEELSEYRRTLALAQRDDAWAWYGLTVYELARLHPYLPESDNPKLMIAAATDLPDAYARIMVKKGGGGVRFKTNVLGRWPDFALEVHEHPLSKLVPPTAPPLGPARLDDFKQPVRTFAEKELFPKLAGDEKRELKRFEGKWPEYPQRLIDYAKKYDLPVPGVTLPGSPRNWDATYGTRQGTRPGTRSSN